MPPTSAFSLAAMRVNLRCVRANIKHFEPSADVDDAAVRALLERGDGTYSTGVSTMIFIQRKQGETPPGLFVGRVAHQTQPLNVRERRLVMNDDGDESPLAHGGVVFWDRDTACYVHHNGAAKAEAVRWTIIILADVHEIPLAR